METSHLPKNDHLFSAGIFARLLPEIQRSLTQQGYQTPTPIQTQSIPPLLDGRDVLGSAQTGTGKTAAFVIPILQKLTVNKTPSLRGKPRVLILAPTRELAAQIGEKIDHYGRHLKITQTVICGGLKQRSQVESLVRGVHIVVATPGRLLDLFNQSHISLEAVQTFVLDEADRMLDMGFLPDIRKVIEKLPPQRQTVFFSATLPPDVMRLARQLVKNPVEIAVNPEVPAVEEIEQKLYFVERGDKIKLLLDLLSTKGLDKVLVFVKMKYAANRLCDKLKAASIGTEAIHGDKSQNNRIRALADFKQARVRVLVATDIAARGIDVENISHVINYDLPHEPETYVHRIGRTARAGSKGDAISFCSAEERCYLTRIEHFIRKRIPVITDHAFHSETARCASPTDNKPMPQKRQPNQTPAARSRARLSKPIQYSDGKTGGRRKNR